jgi:type IV pilus assembly protein PilV
LNRNNSGFTIVELMVATVITLVGLMGVLQAMNYAAQQNLQNQRRDEAVMIAEDWMARFRSVPFRATFSVVSTCAPPACSDGKYQYGPKIVASRLRSGGSYTVLRTTTMSAGGNSADLGVLVRWKFRNDFSTHEVHSIRYRDE